VSIAFIDSIDLLQLRTKLRQMQRLLIMERTCACPLYDKVINTSLPPRSGGPICIFQWCIVVCMDRHGHGNLISVIQVRCRNLYIIHLICLMRRHLLGYVTRLMTLLLFAVCDLYPFPILPIGDVSHTICSRCRRQR
jgi:hypothetical protein